MFCPGKMCLYGQFPEFRLAAPAEYSLAKRSSTGLRSSGFINHSFSFSSSGRLIQLVARI
jgi:hypothetical protein